MRSLLSKLPRRPRRRADRGLPTVTTYSEANLTFDTLPNGNPPNGFVSKGNDYNGVCGTCYPGASLPENATQSCQEACQFDSYCKGNGQTGCNMFGDGTKNSCTGVDVTTPIVCTIPNGATNAGKRKVRVCNRGSADIPANSDVECWQFPGGSPQYPDNDPIANTNNNSYLDTFNEAIAAGQCITHYLDSSAFASNGTESIMCNVRQTTVSTVTLPSAGALPANGKTATSIVSAGTWTSTSNALDTAGNAVASVSLPAATATTAAMAATLPASEVGWTSLSNIGATADGSAATTDVKVQSTPSFSAATATATGTWLNPSNAQGAANATIATTTVNQTTVAAFNGSNAANSVGAWTNVANANGAANNGTFATQTIAANGQGAMWLDGSAIGGTLPDGVTITALTATVQWRGGNVKLKGTVELYKGGVAVGVPSTVAMSVASGAQGFTYTAAQLAGVTGATLKASQAFRIRIDNTSNTNAYLAEIDSITFNVTYASTSPVLRFTGFGLAIPSNATINSVTVNTKVGSTAAVGVTGTLTATAYKSGQSVAAGSASTTLTANTALANLALSPTLTAADLTDANFAVDLSVAAGSTSSFTANVDACTVTVDYTTPVTQSVSLSAFGIESIIPSGVTINSVTTAVVWKIGAANNKATLSAVTKLGATTLSTVSDGNPPTAFGAAASATYTNAGLVTTANLSALSVDLSGTTTGNGYTASIDSLAITVSYVTPGSAQTLELGGYGFAVPVGATNVSLTLQSRWSASSAGTGLCFQAYDGATALGSPSCATSGASPTVLNTLTSSATTISVADANNLSVRVTASGTTAASTANLDYVVAQVQYSSTQTSGVAECNINNNWSVAKTNPPIYCPSTTTTTYYDFYQSRVFDGVCPAGTRTRWRLFAWDSSDPGSTKIEFRFRSFPPTTAPDGTTTCDAQAPVYAGAAPDPLSTAQSAPTDTQVCSLTNPPTAWCPAALGPYLGGLPSTDYRCLQMDAHGYADAAGAPTLNGWTATYDCLPSE